VIDRLLAAAGSDLLVQYRYAGSASAGTVVQLCVATLADADDGVPPGTPPTDACGPFIPYEWTRGSKRRAVREYGRCALRDSLVAGPVSTSGLAVSDKQIRAVYRALQTILRSLGRSVGSIG
jgi:hypothetical protein